MQTLFQKQSIVTFFQTYRIQSLIALFVLARVMSLLTYHHQGINQSIALTLILLFGWICTKDIRMGWAILIAELLLGGSGHFFEFQGLILRTWFLGIFGIIWLWQKISKRDWSYSFSPIFSLAFVGFLGTLGWSIANGLLHNHAPLLIVQDTILYGFFFLLFPAIDFHKQTKQYLIPILMAFLIGSLLFSLISFTIYASELGTLPDTYYHWFRNIAGGKITDLGNHFFRIVLPEHLLLVPLILITVSSFIRNPKQKKWWWVALLAAFTILTLNFSRIYFLALGFGLFLLMTKTYWRRWLALSVSIPVTILLLFMSLHLLASNGQSSGLGLLGFKFGSISTPISDPSGAIRMAILPEALRTIQKHPILGSGLGTTVTFFNPQTQVEETRTQFDWGYLEMLAELGGIGVLSYLLFLLAILLLILHDRFRDKNDFATIQQNERATIDGLLAGAGSLFVINITTPAIFHGFGILIFVFIIAERVKKGIEIK